MSPFLSRIECALTAWRAGRVLLHLLCLLREMGARRPIHGRFHLTGIWREIGGSELCALAQWLTAATGRLFRRMRWRIRRRRAAIRQWARQRRGTRRPAVPRRERVPAT